MVTGQDTRIIWQKSIGGVGYDKVNDIITDANGDVYLLSTVQVANNHEIQVSKMSSAGQFLWTETFGGERDDRGHQLLIDSKGDLLVLGETNSQSVLGTSTHGYIDIIVIRMTRNGIVKNARTYGGTKFEEAASILETTSGHYIVTGTTLSDDGDILYNNGQADVWMFQIDGNGELQWSQTHGGSDDEYAVQTKALPDGSLITVASSSTYQDDYSNNHGDVDVALYHTNGFGVLLWKDLYGGFLADFPADIELLSNGHFLVGVNTYSSDADIPSNAGGQDVLLMEIDQDGDLHWAKTYGSFGNDRIADIEAKTGGFVLFGSSNSASLNAAVSHGSQDYWMYEINEDKEVVDQYLFGASGFDEGVTFALLNDESVIMGGESNSDDGVIGSNMGKNDGWVLRVGKSSGDGLTQASVHPNPSTGIFYVNDLEEGAVLSISNMQGAPISNSIMTYGISKILDLSAQPSGVYFLQVTYGDRKEVHRIVRN